jgi:hypothetical protein
VTVQAFNAATDATQFTSLEGVSYAVGSTGFTPLTLGAGWNNAPFSTRNAAVSVSNGIVRLQGAIASTGTDLTNAFTIPAGFRPSATVYVSTDMNASAPGRVIISSAGAVTLQPANGVATTVATQFTSLEGVWYPLTATGFTAITLTAPWTGTTFMTRNAAFAVSGGTVRLQGAIAAPAGTAASPFMLPLGARPASAVYTPVNLCSGVKGRLNITPAGAVTIQAATGAGGGTAADITCFTSLEGVSFGL